MGKITYFSDLGLSPYLAVWGQQESIFKEIIDIKRQNYHLPPCEQIESHQHLIFCQHPHVYTLGKSGDAQNLLINQIELQANDAEFIKTNRGGDITYHGPGQLVGYPIFDLEALKLSVKEYIYHLEEAIIRVIEQYGIKGKRLDGAIGVWLEATEHLPERKICAIGVKVSRHVSMHGFAMNINTNLDYFNYINPCGFVDKSVTSLQKELGRKMDFEEVKSMVKKQLEDVFDLSYSEL